MTNPVVSVPPSPTGRSLAGRLTLVEHRLERLTRRPRQVQLSLDLASLGFAALLPLRILPPDFLFHSIFVLLVVQAFLFGLRPTLVRVGLWALVITGYVTAVTLGAPLEPMEVAEWPLMFVIAGLVAWMAERRAATARHYGELFRRASDRLLTVQEDERRRIARELHDGVGQLLTALSLRLEAAKLTTGSEVLDEARHLATDALGETRRLANRLRPARLDQVGLVAALRDLSEHAGVAVELDVAPSVDDRRLDPAATAEAYRVVQEALSNVARHAGVDRARLVLDVAEPWLRIRVVDAGCGFDVAAVAGAGLGLVGMEERALLLGGRLVIEAGPGRGTTVELLVPLGPSPTREPVFDVGSA